MERQGKEFENRFYNGIENSHNEPADRKKRNAARILDFIGEKINDAVERSSIEYDADEDFFEHEKIIKLKAET
jgi:hypothetical protein